MINSLAHPNTRALHLVLLCSTMTAPIGHEHRKTPELEEKTCIMREPNLKKLTFSKYHLPNCANNAVVFGIHCETIAQHKMAKQSSTSY